MRVFILVCPVVLEEPMVAENPLHNIPACTAAMADHVIVDYMGVLSHRNQTPNWNAFSQQYIIAAAAPIINLWAELKEQELITT